MAVINCRFCGTRVNAEAIRCPQCGADPRTGEGAVSDEEWMAALRERAALRELARGSHPPRRAFADLREALGLTGGLALALLALAFLALALLALGGVIAAVLLLRRRRRKP